MNFKIAFFVIILFGSITAFAEDNVVLWHGTQRLSYESMALPQDERMGLVGLHFLVDIAPQLYAGLGLFSAVSGNRGGFFTGGFEAGLSQPVLRSLSIDTSVFIGGGGGSSSHQGGGLMVRPQLGLLYDLDDVRLGLSYALVDFPNGDIRSRHAVLRLDLPFEALRIAPEYSSDPAQLLEKASLEAGRPILFRRQNLAARYTVYMPPERIMKLSGEGKTGTLHLTGFELAGNFSDRVYFFVEASGASGGHSDGYAEFFFGSGYRIPLYGRSLFLDGRVAAGASGGGSVDTGGGGAGKASLGLTFTVGHDVSIDTRAGYETSAGTFRAKMVEFGLSYTLDTASLSKRRAYDGTSVSELRMDSWRTRCTFQQYLSRKATTRKDGSVDTISLLGGKIDTFLNASRFYLTGQAQSAFAGGAGGYSIGLIGLGYLSEPIAGTDVHLFAEAVGGAAGGGGVNVGGGAVIEPQAGALYDIGSSAGIEASIGRLKALSGGLDSTVAGISFVYRYSTIGETRRH
jgi:hypothetical protein